MKDPPYIKQSNINWNKNEELCISVARKFRVRWPRSENVDDRVLADWEHEVISHVRITYYKKKCTRI